MTQKRVIVISTLRGNPSPQQLHTHTQSFAVKKQDGNTFSWLPFCYFTMQKNVIFTEVTVLQTEKLSLIISG